ncbi:hypothetical protein ACO2Q2_06635 [Dyella sp. KRB-257]
MTARKIATLLVTLLLLAACSRRAMLDRFAPHPQTERARAMIDTCCGAAG